MTLFSFESPNDNVLIEIIQQECFCVVYTKTYNEISHSIAGSYLNFDEAVSKFKQIINIILSREIENKINKILQP